MVTEDQTLTCSDCGQSFVFTAGEQEFYSAKGFAPVKRCKSCREKRKTDRGGGGGGGGDSQGHRERRDRGASQRPPAVETATGAQPPAPGRDRRSFDIVCHKCGKTAKVPFQPQEGRPVYCRDCYRDRGSTRQAY